MCNNKECAKYFKSQQEYHRCFLEFRKKWQTYGKVTGIITLKQASEKERRAIGGIIGKAFYEQTIRFSFPEFEQGMQKTRFAPVNMKEVLEEYFEEPLITTQERQKAERERKCGFLRRVFQYFEKKAGKEATVLYWLQEMISGKKYGYQLLMKEYTKNEKQAEVLVQNTGNAVMKLEDLANNEEECPLAVLAAEITENPHYFDRGTTAGLLFVHAICCREKMELPKNAHQWRSLLMQVLIIPDNISSMVHAYGLRLLTEQGDHPAFNEFCNRKEPYVITMENMKGIIGARAVGKKVYVVENEMVFSYLLHNLNDLDDALLCTSGQPRSVVQILIPYILASGSEIYYNGDIDPDGICIADRLWKRFGEYIHIWRMSPMDYENSISREKTGDIGRAKLENISHPVLKKTAQCMKEKQLAGYQENMLKVLLNDMKK